MGDHFFGAHGEAGKFGSGCLRHDEFNDLEYSED